MIPALLVPRATRFVAVLALAGCAASRSPNLNGPAPDQAIEILAAARTHGSARVTIGLAAPAHVTVFRVVPGEAVGLLRPLGRHHPGDRPDPWRRAPRPQPGPGGRRGGCSPPGLGRHGLPGPHVRVLHRPGDGDNGQPEYAGPAGGARQSVLLVPRPAGADGGPRPLARVRARGDDVRCSGRGHPAARARRPGPVGAHRDADRAGGRDRRAERGGGEPGLRVGHQPVVAGRTAARLAAFFRCP